MSTVCCGQTSLIQQLAQNSNFQTIHYVNPGGGISGPGALFFGAWQAVMTCTLSHISVIPLEKLYSGVKACLSSWQSLKGTSPVSPTEAQVQISLQEPSMYLKPSVKLDQVALKQLTKFGDIWLRGLATVVKVSEQIRSLRFDLWPISHRKSADMDVITFHNCRSQIQVWKLIWAG